MFHIVFAVLVFSAGGQADPVADAWLARLRTADSQARQAHEGLKTALDANKWTTPPDLGRRTGYEAEVVEYVNTQYQPHFHRAIGSVFPVPAGLSENSPTYQEAARLSANWVLTDNSMGKDNDYLFKSKGTLA